MPEIKDYQPGGSVMRAFHESEAFYRAVAGPIGSSKTTGGAVAEPVFGAMLQIPYEDGVRRFKSGVIRDTYRNLYATTMKTWHEWIPRDVGKFVGSDDRPAIHEFALDTPIGPCEIEVEFRALGSNTVEAVCRGWERNGVYLDEADLLPKEAWSFLAGRVMRAGDKRYRRTRGIWATFNKPDEDHYLYEWCEERGFDGDFAFFDQPPAILPGGPPYVTNPDAENIANLDADYYQRSSMGQPDWYVQRMIRNRWGYSVSGEPIYPEFSAEAHVSKVELEPRPGSTLWIGMDGGGTPAAVIGGRDEYGRRIVYAEVVLADPADPKGKRLLTGIGPTRFADAIRDAIFPRFRGCRFEMGWGDPAAFYGADREQGEYSFMEKVALALDIPVQPAESNEIHIRLDAVRYLLSTPPGYTFPLLLINPSCRWIKRGFLSDYKYEVRDPKQEGKALKPQKTATSHVHDALQYFALGQVGRVGVQGGRAYDRFQPRQGSGLLIPTSPGVTTPWNGEIPAVVRGTHYQMKFNPWG